MARRHVGTATIVVEYADRGEYDCRVTGGAATQSLIIRPPASGYGPGVAYDSPRAYDEVARAALNHAIASDPTGDIETAALAGGVKQNGEWEIRRRKEAS